MTGTSLAMIEEKYRKVFIDFLNYLIDQKVGSVANYNEASKKYILEYNIYQSDFDKAIWEAAKWISNTLPGFKSTKWDEKDVFEAKKGFDILYQYAPLEIRSILRDGGQPILEVYSNKFSKKATSNVHTTLAYQEALATIFQELTELNSGLQEDIIKPAEFQDGEMVNKKLAEDVLKYEDVLVSASNFEEFQKVLYTISGTLSLNLTTDLVTLAKIANKLREVKGLPPL